MAASKDVGKKTERERERDFVNFLFLDLHVGIQKAALLVTL